MDDVRMLVWLERGMNVSALLVAIGVTGEFVGNWIASPIRERINREKDAEIARLNKEAADAQLQLAELKKRQEPRGVPTEKPLSILKEAPPGAAIMKYQDGIPEVALFAGNLHNHLLMAGWKIPKPLPARSIVTDKVLPLPT